MGCESRQRDRNEDCFFFNDTATTEIYPLSLHDALPIGLADGLVEHGLAADALDDHRRRDLALAEARDPEVARDRARGRLHPRSEEHTSELQSRQYLVCRLLLEKKKQNHVHVPTIFSHSL